MTSRDDPNLLTTREVAEMFYVSPNTLCNWRKKGCGPPWARLGPRTIRYPRQGVEDWKRAAWEEWKGKNSAADYVTVPGDE